MKERVAAIGEWLEHRTGIIGGIQHFLYEEIPASSGWHQVFGSVALFLFMVQAFTGIMLAFNYAPTPGDAYDSLRYILTALTAGPLMRGLHHWGASMIVVVVVLHMVQVFLYGAYKKPREATWMVGVVLLLVTLAYGLTGYLLPWDNRAYWGTMVTTQIAAMSPGVGLYLTRLLGAADGIGVVTFARFYAMHVLILPPATILLVALHVFLVRRHGVAPVPGDEAKPKKMFFPMQVFKDTVAIFIAFAILFTMAVAVHVPLEQMADPTNNSYIPRPEWYFLFLFQFLKMFNGPLEVCGRGRAAWRGRPDAAAGSVHRSWRDGEGHQADVRDRGGGAGRARLVELDNGRDQIHAAAGSGGGFLLQHRLDDAHAGQTGGVEVAEHACIRGARRGGLSGEPLQRVPCREWRGRKARPGAEWFVEAADAQLGGAAFRRSPEAFAGNHHAAV